MIRLEMRSIYASADAGTLFPLEFAWIDLACHSVACRPPNSGGTGGSTPGTGGASSSAELDLLFPGRRSSGNKVVNQDGTFSVEGLDAHGGFTKFSSATEAKIADAWKALGPTHDQYVKNFEIAGKLAMGINPLTGKVDAKQAAAGAYEAKWYSQAHRDCVNISKSTGIPFANVVAATTTLSAGRVWSGTANGNIESARFLADIVVHPVTLELSVEHVAFMQWRADKATKGVGKVGLTPILTAGKHSSADLTAGQLVEAMYAIGTLRGQKSFAEFQAMPGKDVTRIQIKTPNPFPIFTSKGVQQVKQAVAVLRQEVTPRQAISGPKYSSFFSNIHSPEADYSSTNDTWHYRIMAGNLPLTSTSKGETRTATIDVHTIKDRAPNGIPFSTAQDLFQRGPASKSEGLASGDGMFRDTTRITRTALDNLKSVFPDQFGKMKIHEFQALIWVHYGGGQTSDKERLARWDGAREAARRAGL